MKLISTVTLLAALVYQSNANGKFKKLLEWGVCEADVATFCPGLERRELKQCMKSHFDEFSLECTNAIEEMKHVYGEQHHPRTPPEVREACHDDTESLCPGLKKWEVKKCMHEKHDQISEKCTTAWKTWKDSLPGHHVPDEVKEACHDDKEKLCRGIKGKWHVRMCMKKHWADVSEKCTTAVKDWMKDRHHVPDSVKEACHDDKEKFCGDIKCPMKVKMCMKKHWGDLSEKCTTAIKEWKKDETVPEEEMEVRIADDTGMQYKHDGDSYMESPELALPCKKGCHSRHEGHGRHHPGKFLPVFHILGVVCGLTLIAVVIKSIVHRARSVRSTTAVPVDITGFTIISDDDEDDVVTGIPVV